ncbi:hypothetical protein ISN45_At04g033800 [Arabidopsis thaliana x Arabidopsis arenosa]|uniref:Uncharacterized protein n=1 Tax=Arabidopsis thaliana x Arabidopsis arenosa TaxID=1240361 RepID=A0A8T2E4R6_9BRAS|nr:hypothetical protein ISN45_At04g033800 [Arabidopsis thaliana x Arabidopsis arenosa]
MFDAFASLACSLLYLSDSGSDSVPFTFSSSNCVPISHFLSHVFFISQRYEMLSWGFLLGEEVWIIYIDILVATPFKLVMQSQKEMNTAGLLRNLFVIFCGTD